MTDKHTVDTEWVHVKFADNAAFKDVYGFAGNQGVVNLEGIRFVPRGQASDTLLVGMSTRVSAITGGCSATGSSSVGGGAKMV